MSDSYFKTKASRIILFIGCVLLSFGLWIYVMSVESPAFEQTFTNVTVELENTDALNARQLAIYNGYGTLVDVTFSGKKSTLSKLAEHDIVLTADVSSVENAGRTDCKIRADVPAGCRLVSISQETVSVYADSSANRSFPLTEERENISLPEGLFIGTIEYPVDNISVEGPQMVLDRIDRAVVSLDMSGVTSTTELTSEITLLDSDGVPVESRYISCSPSEVTVTVPVQMSVTLPVEVGFKYGFLSHDTVRLTVVPKTVTAVGDPEVISRGINVPNIIIDEKTDFISSGVCVKTAALEEQDGITLSTDMVTVTAELDESIGTAEITIPSSNIHDIEAKDGVVFRWEEKDINVTLLGRVDVLPLVTQDDIVLQLDMSPYSATNTGTSLVRASVVLSKPFKDSIMAVGTYDISVTFGESETNE